MIEAVNSVIANNIVLRSSAVQGSAPSVNVPAPSAEGEAPRAPQAPFVSPYIALDTVSNRAVLQIRDSDTGDVEQQFPTESRLVQIQEAQARAQQRDVPSTPTPVAQTEGTQTTPINTDVISVETVTSTPPSNTITPIPDVATAALSAGAQSGQSVQTSSLSVLA